jgi:hypothetical protein
MIITFFGALDLGQQPHEPQEIPGGVGRFGLGQSQSTQLAELRSQVIVRQ